MTSVTEVIQKIKDQDVKFVDLRFTDPRARCSM